MRILYNENYAKNLLGYSIKSIEFINETNRQKKKTFRSFEGYKNFG